MEGELLTNQVIEKAVAPPASHTFEKCGFISFAPKSEWYAGEVRAI